ncbi:MAG: hypothetical protein H6718_21015 [Polyangiaceae bacterium]|nr:hypothetical protein [Myxococcales bacterium]MCB9587899.1 hypothetical protein [Polyangiaceae bacterium]MCB9608848.1 hypothetical protein [Polyangiaceae bacterium]
MRLLLPRCILLLCLTSCSKRSAEELPRPEASAAVSSSPFSSPPPFSSSPQASPGTALKSESSVSKERASPPESSEAIRRDFELRCDFELFRGATGRVFSLKHAALICAEPCRFPAAGKQKLWLVKADAAEPADQYWPSNVWGTYSGAMQQADLHTQVSFLGAYPGEVMAFGAAESRSGEGNLPLVRFVSGAWRRDYREIPSDKPSLPPREYDAALLSAPVDRNPLYSFAYGAGAPAMATDKDALLIHDGKQWTTKPAEWGRYAQLTRLADGNTLVVEQGAWLITPKGEISLLDVELPHAETAVDIAGETWLLDDTHLWRPREKGRFKSAQPPKRTARGSSTLAKPIKDPTEFNAQCKTPIVIVNHSDGTQVHGEVVASLFAEDRGNGAGLEAYAVRFAMGDRSVVQAKDKATAERLLDVLKSRQHLSGELRCADLKALLPDPYAGSAYLRRLFIHARSGALLELT